MTTQAPPVPWIRGTARRIASAGVVRTVPSTGASAAVTVAFFLAMSSTLLVRTGEFALPPAPVLVAGLLTGLPLLLRTRAPLVALIAVVLAESWYIVTVAFTGPVPAEAADLMGVYQPVPLASVLATWTFASRAGRRQGWTAGGAAAVALFVAGVVSHGRLLLFTDLVMANVVVLATAVGVAAAARRERREVLERRRQEHTTRAVLDERLQIARELHDVLAHNLTLVNAQASVAQYLLGTNPAAAETALKDITRHSARAIDELRATVGLLRRDGERRDEGDETLRPTPDLDAVDALVQDMRGIGLDVVLETRGTRVALGPHGDLAAYRILQESLTNAAKHAAGASVEVGLTWEPGGLSMRVRNSIRTPAATASDRPPTTAPGTGHGLIGMRERARAAGGVLEVDPAATSFTVTAHIPVDGGSPHHPALPTKATP